MSDQFQILKQKYKHMDPGEALFINAGSKALRLEVASIGKEFSAGVFIGKDPQGLLYYNHADSFDPRQVNFKCIRYINPADSKTCAWIKFYTDSEDHCHAEFLAYDPDETVQACGMDGWTSTGDWKDLDMGSATAFIRKYDDSQAVKITVSTVHKQAIITDSGNSLDGESVDVKGNLFFKDSKTISDGKFASYNNDRIVFYKDTGTSTDFTAYFIPYESSVNKLGIASASTTEFSNVVWSDT
ncbi:hypothetical protein FRC01_001626 [Tulasnella sp. 417]|nr:hypothetical protein FRC01_001626 [Tulasnella sp. 417]